MRGLRAAAVAGFAAFGVVGFGSIDGLAAGGVSVVVVGDAIPLALDGQVGDADRGRQIVIDRRRGNCLICHQAPLENELFQGELGPNLAGVALRLSAGQLRLRLVDQSRLNPDTLMPPYHRTHGLWRVPAGQDGHPILQAREIEDIVAWLLTLN